MSEQLNPILIEIAWLDRQLEENPSRVLLVDARRAPEYRRGHLPHAVHLDTFPYANERTDPDGLKQIEADWARMFGESGITPDDIVVFYDTGTENRAPRGAFMLRYLGHSSSHVLHGGVSAWLSAGRSLAKDAPTRQPAPGKSYPINPQRGMIATGEDVLNVLGNPDVVLFDNREQEEYLGKRRLQWNPRMGRIPGCKHVVWWELLEDKQRFRSDAELREILESRGITPDKEVIVYCQKSHRATNSYLALERLGYPRRRVYIGSFREWSRRKEYPVEREGRTS